MSGASQRPLLTTLPEDDSAADAHAIARPSAVTLPPIATMTASDSGERRGSSRNGADGDANGEGLSGNSMTRRSALGQIVIIGESGKPVCLDEGEVRNLNEDSPSKSEDGSLRRRASKLPSEGMALALVRGATHKTPVFRALTPGEALQTSTAGLAAYAESDDGAGGAAGRGVDNEAPDDN